MTAARKAKRASKRRAEPTYVLRFLIVLAGTDPLVWRRIQVPAGYSFWDLHVAIQDAMGWKDCHLHEFVIPVPRSNALVRVGIPGDEMDDLPPCLEGWKVGIEEFLDPHTGPVRYLYDFGDDWKHTLEFEDIERHDGGAYPRCLAGAGACPPEDVGGTHGYAEFLRVIANRRHPEHAATLEWAGGRFDPDAFRLEDVTFDDPRERWEIAFGDEESDR